MSRKPPSLPRHGLAVERRQLSAEEQPDAPRAVTKAPKPRSSRGPQWSLVIRHGTCNEVAAVEICAPKKEKAAASRARARKNGRIPGMLTAMPPDGSRDAPSGLIPGRTGHSGGVDQ